MKKLTLLLILLTILTINADDVKKCWSKAGKITVINPELFEHGMTESLKNSTENYDLNDIAKFNGHICAGSTAGFLMTKMALKKLFPNEIPIQGDIRITASRPSGATDIAGFITGALPHFGMPTDKMSIDTKLHRESEITIVFTRISTGKSVTAVFLKKKLLKNVLGQNMKEFINLKDKVDNGSRKPETIKAFGRYVQKLVCELVSGKHKAIIIR